MRVKLPCGHHGEYIIGRFALCEFPRCDTSERMIDRCPHCGGELKPFQAPMCPPGSKNCHGCGKVFWKGWNA